MLTWSSPAPRIDVDSISILAVLFAYGGTLIVYAFKQRAAGSGPAARHRWTLAAVGGATALVVFAFVPAALSTRAVQRRLIPDTLFPAGARLTVESVATPLVSTWPLRRAAGDPRISPAGAHVAVGSGQFEETGALWFDVYTIDGKPTQRFDAVDLAFVDDRRVLTLENDEKGVTLTVQPLVDAGASVPAVLPIDDPVPSTWSVSVPELTARVLTLDRRTQQWQVEAFDSRHRPIFCADAWVKRICSASRGRPCPTAQ